VGSGQEPVAFERCGRIVEPGGELGRAPAGCDRIISFQAGRPIVPSLARLGL